MFQIPPHINFPGHIDPLVRTKDLKSPLDYICTTPSGAHIYVSELAALGIAAVLASTPNNRPIYGNVECMTLLSLGCGNDLNSLFEGLVFTGKPRLVVNK